MGATAAIRSGRGGSAGPTVRTSIPARLDRLPWARFHWMVVIGLGTVWILDGLEVTVVSSIASRLTEPGSGIAIGAGSIGTAAACYVGGACAGALFFGQLTDRFGRKRLFLLTLALYIAATIATAFAFSAWYLFLARFVTGAGIGGEYAAINSAIDELIPARVRGRVDLIINGSYWAGSAAGSAAALFFLSALFPKDIGWRLAFAVGAVLGLGIMVVRRHVPESPRWLFIHGRQDEAEAIVDGIERAVEAETGQRLDRPDEELRIRQRHTIPFREIAGVAFRRYPRRAVLGLALFVGQAFLYNGVTFNLGDIFSGFFKVSSGFVPVYIIVFAAGNLLGPLLLGRLFDTVGRKPMISGTYLGSAVVTVVMAVLFIGHVLGNSWAFLGFIVGIFFLASAGASAAYLTVSEIFPMETRALAIAFFYAVGTGIGGIAGPLLFGGLVASGSRTAVAVGFLIGAAVMTLGGVAEVFLGVRAEGRRLEELAEPITAVDAASASGDVGAGGPDLSGALALRRQAEEERARAAEHRAKALELRTGTDPSTADRAAAEQTLAEMADLRADAADQRAEAADHRARVAAGEEPSEGADAVAAAAEERAGALLERAESLAAADEAEAARHRWWAEAAAERARSREQAAEAARRQADAGADTPDAPVAAAAAERHTRWSQHHAELAARHEAEAAGDRAGVEEHGRRAAELEQLALAAEERVGAAEHRRAAAEVLDEEEEARATRAAAERDRAAAEAEARARERLAARAAWERQGLRRFAPGPGSTLYSPGMVGTATRTRDDLADLDREVEVIERAVDEQGAVDRDELARRIGARYWGPGRFRAALRQAEAEGRVRRLSRSTYGPVGDRR